MWSRHFRIFAFVAVVLAALPLGQATSEEHVATAKSAYRRPAGAPPGPADNPPSVAKIRLGGMLFRDRRLSGDDTLACVDCHRPAQDWQDGLPRARGAGGIILRRRTPSLYDVAWGETFFWDGRAASLEAQALGPIEAPDEMNLPVAKLVERLQGIDMYRDLFADAFPDAPAITPESVAKALAAFERSIVSGTTPFDRWVEGDESAIDAAAKRGFALFNGKANCSSCHSGWRLTDDGFHDIGLPSDDSGRGPVIAVPLLNHAFKTPSLRNVARRAPYMHDGSLPDLHAVVNHYADGILDRPTLSDDLKRITLSEMEREDLVAFLQALSDDGPHDGQ